MFSKCVITAVTGFFLVLAPTGAAAQAADMYIKIEGIEGESRDANHDKWIDVLSVSWGAAGDPAVEAERPRRPTNPRARRRGDVKMEDVTLTKSWDASSPKLAEACARGEHIPKVDVYLARSSDGVYLRYELKNVMVTSYSLSGASGGAVPTESITLNFAEVEWTYAETDDTKKISPTVTPDRSEG